MPSAVQDAAGGRAAYARARRRVRARTSFYGHLGAFVVVNLVLVVLNLAHSPDTPWSVFPLVGWGVGLFFHFLGVFVLGEGSRLEERMIERELRRGDEC